MNKIFKVVWSKTKECYVVVSEVAKNNGGKKKVLASVLATLAIMGAGAQMGTPVQAGANNSGTSVNLWGDKKLDGSNNSANIVGEESVAIGTNLRAGSSTAASTTPANYTHTPGGRYGGNAIAIGKDSSAHDDRNIAIGYKNTTEGQDSVAMGSNVIAGTGQSIAIGSSNTDETTGVVTQTIARGKVNIVNGRPGPAAAIAIGAGAQALDGSGVLAMGQLAYASGNNNVAIGTQTNVNGSNATAIGSTAQALGRSSAAYGTQAFANGLGAVAVGPGANAGVSNSTGTIDGEREGATAVGRGSRATDKAATAIGWSANASKQNATALGYGSIANIAGGVALGSESKTTKDAGETGYNPATGRTNDYNKLTNNTKAALTSTRAAVSIGDDSASVTRQLTGLAAGTQDTDAVNVAQLKAVNLKFAGDSTQVTGSTDVRLNDGTFNVNGDGTLISTEATTTGIKVKAKVGGTITNDPSNDGKAKAPTTDGIATTTNVTNAINNSGWKVTSSNNGGTTNGTSVEKVSPGDKVTFSAGKNIVLDQNGKQFTYSLSDTVALTNTGSLTVGSTKVSNGGVTITAPTGGTTTNVTLTQSGLDNGGNKIVNVKDGDVSATSKDAVNGSQLHAVAAKERHIAPTTASHDAYTVDNNGDVTLDYVDGDGAATSEKAIIKGVAKQDLSNITNAGKQVITGLSNKVVAGDNVTVDETEDATTKQKTYKVNAKLAKLEDGTNTTVSGNGTAANPYHVNVAGDLTGISSITNGGTNNGKISFGPNKTVTVDGDHSITLNASTGKIGGLQNLTFDPTNFTSGQAATEDQLKSVHDTLKASELHIAPTESNRTGEHIAGGATSNTAAGAAANAYKYDATTKQVVLEYNDGTGANKTGTKAVIDFSALNTGAGASSWNIASDKVSTTEGTVAAGSAATQNIADGKTVTMKAGKNLTVKQENVGGNASVAFSLDKDLKDLDSVTTNKTITKEITLKDPNGGSTSTTIKKDGDRITYTNDGSTTVNKVANLADEKHITPGTYSVDNTGKVTMTYTDGNNTLVPNTTTVIDGLVTKKLDNIDNDGKKTITGLGTIVKAGDNVTVSEASDTTTGQKTYTVNAVTPAVYTKADGTKVYKIVDPTTGAVTWNTSPQGNGTNVNAGDVITSFETPANGTTKGSTTGGTMIVNNVGSAINGKTGATYLDKLDAAAGDNNTKNAAVNVTDLKNTKDGLIDKGLKFDANVGGVKTNKLGSTVKVQGAGTSADADYSGANIKTFISQTGDDTTIDVKLDKNLKGINKISNGGSSITLNDTPSATVPAVTITGGNLSMGDGTTNNKIVNLAPGTADTDAVNVKQLKDTELHITPGTYTPDTNKKVKLTYTDGNGTVVSGKEAVIDLSGLSTGGATASTWDIKSSADTANGGATATGHETNAKTIANTNSVEMIAGKNLTVKQTSDTNGAKVEFALSDEIAVGKDGANGKIGVNGKDGASVVIDGKDGSIGLTGAPGTPGTPGASATLKVKDGVPGVDGAPGTNLTRIVYTDKNNVEHEVATHDDGMKFAGDDGQANQATNANVIKKHLNNVVDIIGGATKADLTTNNIGVNNDGNGKLLVQLSKNLNGINTIKNGNTTITLNDAPGGATNTPAVTISGGNLSVDGNKVTNVDDGTDNNDAVNVKQLKAAKTEVKAGENVTVKHTTDGTDNHNIYTVSAVTPAVYTTADGTKVYKIVDPTTGAVTWNTSPQGNGTNVNAGDVITSFETPANGTTKGSTTGGTMIVNNVGSAINGKTGATYLDKLDAAAGDNNTKNAAVNVTDLKNTKDGLIDKGLKFDANVGGVKTNKLGSTVKVQGAGTSADADYSGTNIKTFISQTGDDTTIDVKLDKNLKGINKISNGGSSITLNDTPSATVPAVTITGGNLSMGDGTTNNKIVNLAPGTADTDAVNVKQLKDTELHITPGTYTPDTNKKVKLTYTDGNGTVVSGKEAVIDLSGLSTGGATASTWNVKSSANTTDGGAVGANHNANAQNIANGKTVEFQSGKNLVVNQTNDTTNGNATVEFSLSDNITVGKDGANGKNGSVGAKGADGSAVVMKGEDGSIGLNGTNGANGISIKGKDGANGVGIDGKDGVTRIVYTEKVPDPANTGTTKEVTHEVATMDDGLKFTGNNTGTVNKHKLGSLVKVQGEGVSATDEAAFVSASGNIAVTAENNDTLTIRLNKNLKGLNSIQLGGNTIQSNGDNITFTTNGGTTKTVATTDQLWTIQANGTDVPATNGKVNVVGKDGITVAKNSAGNLEISGTGLGTMNGFDVTANNGATSKTITDGKKVDFNAGSNLTVKQTSDANGTHIEYALKEAVDLGTNGSLKAGDTTVNKDGVTIANGPSITKTGVDAGDKKITNVADGAVNATSKDAVNGSQLKKYTDAAKTTVEAGDTNVKVETDNSAADGHTNYKVSLEPVVTIGDTHKVKIDGHTGDITGLTNVDLTDPTFATKGRAATEEQLNKVLTEAKKKAVEKVQAGTAAAGDTNIATVAPKAGDTFGTAGATYEVSVSKNAVKDAAKEAVKVTSASPAITVTADTSVAHETTYKVGFDGNQAATQIPLTYKQNGGNTRTVKLSDGLNFIDGTNTKARTAADGKVTFDVMGDLTGITSISNAAGGPKMTFGGNSINVTGGNLDMGGKKITNIGKGTDPTDAARVGQLTKVTSNNHSVVVTKTTDADGAPVYDLAVTGTPGAPAADPRVDMLGEEIGRVGAQGAALSALKPIQYDPLEPTQIMAGYGNYRGNSAIAMGVAHYKNESTMMHAGLAWAGGSRHMMANAGVTWKVGNRDSEAAVADRYRKGPISSAYAMQQEMAAMKAQNAGLKGEVSDLKAENEQMKAQIAAMMAKLGL